MFNNTSCSICLSTNKRYINVFGTDLQSVYEKLAEFKARAELCFLCYICCARLRQVANLLNAAMRFNQSPKAVVHLMTQNIENATIPYHVVLAKKEPPEFDDVQEKYFEHDNVSIEPKRESIDYIDKIGIIENSIKYEVEEKTTFQSKNAIAGTTQDSQNVGDIHEQQKQKVLKVLIVQQSQCAINEYINQNTTTRQVAEYPENWSGQTGGKGINHVEKRPNTDDCEQRDHASTAQFTCDVCLKNYFTKYLLRRHMRTHTGKLPFNCEICSKKFSQKSSLNVHIRSHIGEKPFSCDICSKNFSTKALLNVHVRIHTGITFSCDICLKKFSQKSSLNLHTKLHTGEKLFGCDICSKKFSRKDTLNVHMISHTGEKPFSCDICSKKFAQKNNLTAHIRIHTGIKPFSCDICSKKFSSKRGLSLHIKGHKGEKPFSCDICSKNFSTKAVLNVHVRIHTGIRYNIAFSCDICSKKFSQKSSLKGHAILHRLQLLNPL